MKYILRMIKKKGLTDPIKLLHLVFYLQNLAFNYLHFWLNGKRE